MGHDGVLRLTILILDQAVEEDTSHGNGVTGEVRVVVHALANLKSSRRVHVAGEQGEDVVLDAMLRARKRLPTLSRNLQLRHDEP